MKALKKWMPLAFAGLLAASSAQAATIDFTGLADQHDPTIGEVSFWAGVDPLDTIVFDDGSNEFLLSGNGGGYDTFIGVTKSGTAFGSVSFQIQLDIPLPTPTTLKVQAFNSGSVVVGATAEVITDDGNFHTVLLSQVGAFDMLHIYDDLNQDGIGEYFSIDNFIYTEYQPPCTGPNCNPTSVPEPSALLLLGIGMAGFAFARKYKSA